MIKRVFIILLLIPMFMGCKEINLGEKDSGKTVSVSVGDIIKVTLPSNRSTGNSWRAIEFDNNILAQAADPEYEKSNTGLVGAAGQVVYSFKALKKGVTKLDMEYGAMYDLKKAPVKKFNVEIVVK